MAILDEAIEAHRAAPKDNIISSLVAEEASGTLTNVELRHLCALLLIAGHETTTNLLANGMQVLARHPGLFDRLKADQALLPAFVEEQVRMTPPLQRLMRRVTREAEQGEARNPVGAQGITHPG